MSQWVFISRAGEHWVLGSHVWSPVECGDLADLLGQTVFVASWPDTVSCLHDYLSCLTLLLKIWKEYCCCCWCQFTVVPLCVQMSLKSWTFSDEGTIILWITYSEFCTRLIIIPAQALQSLEKEKKQKLLLKMYEYFKSHLRLLCSYGVSHLKWI